MIHVWLNQVKVMNEYKTMEEFEESLDYIYFRKKFPDAPENPTNEYYARKDGTYYMFD